MYKIKINCTHFDDLNFKNKKIAKVEYANIISVLQNIINLSSIRIVHKKNKKFTTKTIEFLFTDLTLNTFYEFIKLLKYYNFNCKKNTDIQFIHVASNDILFNYKFHTGFTVVEPFIKKKNKSTYRVETIY